MYQHRSLRLAAALVALIASACGGGAPLTYSAPVGLSLKAAANDVDAGTITIAKNINTESGNPYGAFIADAQAALGGADPARLEVSGLTVELATSSGTTSLGEVFDGEVAIAFELNSGTVLPVGTRTFVAADAAGPLAFAVAFDASETADADFADLLGGGFKTVLTGPAATGFDGGGADADLELTLTFAAFEE